MAGIVSSLISSGCYLYADQSSLSAKGSVSSRSSDSVTSEVVKQTRDLSAVKVVSIAKWQAFLHTLAILPDFTQKIEKIKKYCTYTQESDAARLKITINGERYDFVLYKGGYESQAIGQSAFEETGAKDKTTNEYFYFKIYENEDEKQTVLLIRSDLGGIYGEVLNIYKRKSISGNEVKAKLCLPMLEALRVDTVLKNDDAVIRTIQVGEDIINMYLCKLSPIVSATGSSEEGDTWYSKDGFSPIDCCKLCAHKKGHKTTQDKYVYFAALERLRNSALKHLHDQVFKSPDDRTLLSRLYTTYVRPASKEHRSIDFQQATLSDLGHAIFTKAKTKVESAESKQANLDLDNFYLKFLTSRQLLDKSSEDALIYNLALNILEHHYIWAKSYADPSQNITYKEFKKLPHRSLAEIIKPVKLTRFSNWPAVADALFKNRVDTKFRNDSEQVQVRQMTRQMLLKELERISLSVSPEELIRELCLISTKASFKDDKSEVYWQLWIEVPNGKEKSYIEWQIVQLPESYQITLLDYPQQQVLFQALVGSSVKTVVSPEGESETLKVVKRIAQSFQKFPQN